MLNFSPFRVRFKLFLLVTFFCAIPVWAALQEDLKEVSNLYEQNKLDMALDKVNALLAQQPKEAQAHFLKALILTEQKKTTEAIQVLIKLTEDYPTLPEPYNNLAVLYAAQGRYDEAKATLERAIHTHPSYATAHENLGDIYAQLARRAYDKALQLDKSNTIALSKLALIKDLFVAPNPPLSTATAPQGKNASSVKPQVEPAVALNTTSVIHPAVPESKTNAPVFEEPIKAMVNAWAKAWSTKQVESYLAFYAPDFDTSGEKREVWEQMRRSRIERPKNISVTIKILSIKVDANGIQATVVFQQNYRSDILKDTTVKKFQLVRQNEKWLIRSEQVFTLERNSDLRLGSTIKVDLPTTQTATPIAFADKKLAPNTGAHWGHEAREQLAYNVDAPPTDYLPAALLQLAPQHRHALLVDSERSRLYVFRNVQGRPQYVANFYISSGKNGIDKMREGDQRTPLGIYHVTALLPKEKLPDIDLYGPSAFTLNYPNEWDRYLGKSGSGIWIHGTSSNIFNPLPQSTNGCVVLNNDDLLTIAKYIDVGNTPVIILPKIKWMALEQWQNTRAVFTRLIEKWKDDWESADNNAYFGYYSQKFNVDGKNFNARMLFNRNERTLKNNSIKVEISNLSVFDYPNESPMVMMTFDQQFKDKDKLLRTKKHQYWTFENGAWKIIHEATITS